MLSTLSGLLLAGNNLRPKALALASAPVARPVAPPASRPPVARVPRRAAPQTVASSSPPAANGPTRL